MVDFILKFKKVYREFEQEYCMQEDSLKDFSLLRSSNLSRNDIQDVLTIANDVTYDFVKSFTQKSTGGESDIMVGALGIKITRPCRRRVLGKPKL